MNALQRARFQTALTFLPSMPASLAASGGVLLGKDFLFDLVRPGIGLFGGNPQIHAANPFKPVVRLRARILQVRCVDKGQSVGYGATFRAERPLALATAALGYADGLMRAIGQRGVGVILGIKVPIVGRLSMDLVTLDVSDVPTVAPGDEVEFLGGSISVDDLAAAAGTAPYEILTSLSRRAERRYLRSTA